MVVKPIVQGRFRSGSMCLLLSFLLAGLYSFSFLGGTSHFRESLAAAPQIRPTVDVDLGQPRYPFSFIVYGDIRFTDPGNTRDTDPARRVALIDRIVAERPDFLVITGDLVLQGDRTSDWEVYDRETQPLSSAGIPIFPVMGNHDLASSVSLARANWRRQFPRFQHRWNSVRYGNSLFLMLHTDSDTRPESPQRKWMESHLDRLPVGIDYVFVVTHHPSYTRYMSRAHSRRNSEQRLASFLEERQKTVQAKLFELSGHVHNYERYENGGVMYIVTAGGGATPYAVPRKPDDYYRETGPTYHYCRFTVNGSHLKFEMVKMVGEGKAAKWMVKDSFELTKNASQGP